MPPADDTYFPHERANRAAFDRRYAANAAQHVQQQLGSDAG